MIERERGCLKRKQIEREMWLRVGANGKMTLQKLFIEIFFYSILGFNSKRKGSKRPKEYLTFETWPWIWIWTDEITQDIQNTTHSNTLTQGTRRHTHRHARPHIQKFKMCISLSHENFVRETFCTSNGDDVPHIKSGLPENCYTFSTHTQEHVCFIRDEKTPTEYTKTAINYRNEYKKKKHKYKSSCANCFQIFFNHCLCVKLWLMTNHFHKKKMFTIQIPKSLVVVTDYCCCHSFNINTNNLFSMIFLLLLFSFYYYFMFFFVLSYRMIFIFDLFYVVDVKLDLKHSAFASIWSRIYLSIITPKKRCNLFYHSNATR